jgi:hypothetical protein
MNSRKDPEVDMPPTDPEKSVQDWESFYARIAASKNVLPSAKKKGKK